MVAILGANGSGKTTLLQTLAGLRAPRSGTILLAGRAIGAWSARARAQRLGLLFQDDIATFPATVEETVAAGFSIMLSDPHVRGILINIFGGILRCDIVAHGIVNAARKLDIAVPLVVRLEGTNVAEGRRILRESGLRFHTASSMSEAARLIVGLAAESPQEAGV